MEVPDYPDYLVYDDGRIFSKKRRKMLKPRDNGYGYHQVALCKDGKVKNGRVNRLVAQAYIPNPENKCEVDHIDRDKSNNHVSNLRWVTSSENKQNRRMFKTNKLGIKNICWNKVMKRYCYAKVLRGDCHQKYFKTLEEAIAYKEEYEATLR